MSGNTYIPNCIVSTKNFSGAMVPIAEFYAKNWTPQMIELLGEPEHRNDKGTRFWSTDRVNAVVASEEFRIALIKLVRKSLQKILGGGATIEMKMPVNDELILAGCNALFDLNKHIKAKAFRAASSKRAYELKAFFLQYLYTNGYAQVVFETDTNLFRFVVNICDTTFVWHQPKNQVTYVSACPVIHREVIDADNAINNPKHEEVMVEFEKVALRLLIDSLEASQLKYNFDQENTIGTTR